MRMIHSVRSVAAKQTDLVTIEEDANGVMSFEIYDGETGRYYHFRRIARGGGSYETLYTAAALEYRAAANDGSESERLQVIGSPEFHPLKIMPTDMRERIAHALRRLPEDKRTAAVQTLTRRFELPLAA